MSNINHCDIAIVGASFAGLSSYLVLRKRLGKDANIKIFDKRAVFTYTPGLHECLGNATRLATLQFDLKKYYGDVFVQQEVHHIHENHELCTKDTCGWKFDYGIIATGSKPQFFNNENWKNNGYTIRWPEDIVRLNTVLPLAQTVTVIGGGITGVETASVIKQRRPEKKVQLVHSRKQVLDSMGYTTAHKAHTYLEHMGIVMLCGKRLKDIQPTYITLADDSRYDSDVTIVSAGVTADNQAHYPHLTFEGSYTALESDNMYLAGDVAVHGLLPTAHNAFFEGRRAGHRIADKIQGKQKQYPPLHNRSNLAIALGTQDGIMTFGKRGVYLPYFTGWAKWLVEKRVLFEFTQKIMLPI